MTSDGSERNQRSYLLLVYWRDAKANVYFAIGGSFRSGSHRETNRNFSTVREIVKVAWFAKRLEGDLFGPIRLTCAKAVWQDSNTPISWGWIINRYCHLAILQLELLEN